MERHRCLTRPVFRRLARNRTPLCMTPPPPFSRPPTPLPPCVVLLLFDLDTACIWIQFRWIVGTFYTDAANTTVTCISDEAPSDAHPADATFYCKSDRRGNAEVWQASEQATRIAFGE